LLGDANLNQDVRIPIDGSELQPDIPLAPFKGGKAWVEVIDFLILSRLRRTVKMNRDVENAEGCAECIPPLKGARGMSWCLIGSVAQVILNSLHIFLPAQT
jgi:hypothetical protein